MKLNVDFFYRQQNLIGRRMDFSFVVSTDTPTFMHSNLCELFSLHAHHKQISLSFCAYIDQLYIFTKFAKEKHFKKTQILFLMIFKYFLVFLYLKKSAM